MLTEQEVELNRNLAGLQERIKNNFEPGVLDKFQRDLSDAIQGRPKIPPKPMFRRQISINDRYFKMDFTPERKYGSISENELHRLHDTSADLEVIRQTSIELKIRRSSSKVNGTRFMKFVNDRIEDQVELISNEKVFVDAANAQYERTGNLPRNAVEISEDEFNQAAYDCGNLHIR
ncbi:Oidioi.mRNA.OKI2018_I69.PAR.g12889.t1.cds [Oikopleura dioica]|uniref:Oidioi.mRNA.OKI2018_I69.PAR.g12889.t1.cds n=1 Tax=Oikopleura dioica TaxID=34765 RepID=A0ABN7S7J2_OIKDI|nr:Oidioi.mRNA.OKI2018_I69.PAR.g12889.t1.cds [Oikopleura dioica]